MNRQSLRYGIQLLGTLAILAWVPGSVAKLFLLVAWWGITFGPLHAGEWALFLAGCVFFSLMNTVALQQGSFAFAHPDLWGMPYYEFVMWGFYLLHGYRLLDGAIPATRWGPIGAATLVFAAAHALIRDPELLAAVTGLAFLAALIWFHEPQDLAYAGYFAVLGLVVEATGVASGQWSYPGRPLLVGIPLWFLPLWAGVGLFLRRLVLPAGRRLAPGAGPDGRGEG